MRILEALFAIVIAIFAPEAAQEAWVVNDSVTVSFCGDFSCDANETCSSCALDCGRCREDILESVKESVVWVKYDYFHETQNAGYYAQTASGSGVIVDQNENYLFVISNRHVMDCRYTNSCWRVWNENISVRTQDGVLHQVERIGFDPQNLDIAYLRVQKKVDKNYTVAFTQDFVEVGDSVIAAGYPAYKVGGIAEFTSSEGTISGIKELILPSGRLLYSIESDVFTYYGSSGGGFFNDKGELIGISTWGINLDSPEPSESIAIKIDSLVEPENFNYCKDGEFITRDNTCEKYRGTTHRLLCFYTNDKLTTPLEGRVYYNDENQGKTDDGCISIKTADLTKEGKIEFDRDYQRGLISYEMEYSYPATEHYVITWFLDS